MARGDKSKYTDKQKRKAEHIAEGRGDLALHRRDCVRCRLLGPVPLQPGVPSSVCRHADGSARSRTRLTFACRSTISGQEASFQTSRSIAIALAQLAGKQPAPV